jgi:hypothetical protein
LQLLWTWRAAWSGKAGLSKLSVADNGTSATVITPAWVCAAVLAAGISAQLGTNVAPKRKAEMVTTAALLIIFIRNSFFSNYSRYGDLLRSLLIEVYGKRTDSDPIPIYSFKQLTIRQTGLQIYSQYFESNDRDS